MTTTKEEIVKAERGFWEFASDPNYYAQNMDDRALSVIEPMGFVPKTDAVEMAKKSEGWSDLRMLDVNVTELTRDCATIVYHGEARPGKGGTPYRASVNSVYVRNGDRWMLAMTSHQPWPRAAVESKG